MIIAELVMQEVEEKALETSPVKPKWWHCYVDDSNMCWGFSQSLKHDKYQHSVYSTDAYNNHGQE